VCRSAIWLALWALAARAAPSYVQGNCFSDPNPNASVSVTLGAVDAGDLLVVAAAFVDPAASVVSMTDSLGSTFTAVGAVARSSSEGAQLFYGISESSGTDVLTASWSTSVSVGELFVHEYSGLLPGPSLLGWVSQADAGRPIAGGPLDTSPSVELLFAHVINTGTALAVRNGFTLQQSCFGDASADLLAPGVGSHSVAFDNSRDAGDWVVTLAAFGTSPAPLSSRALAVGCDCDQAGAPFGLWGVVVLAGSLISCGRGRCASGRPRHGPGGRPGCPSASRSASTSRGSG
jgi:hypothetical protein